MRNPKRKLPPLLEWLLVTAIIIGFLVVLYPVVKRSRNHKGAHGKMVPTQSPHESNRIIHATGLSIIAPINWEQILDKGPSIPFLCIASRGMPGRRHEALITITQCEKPTDDSLKRFLKVKFQQHVAFEKMTIERKGTFDDLPSSSYDLYVLISGQWWYINFFVAEEMTLLPEIIRQYIETIKFP